MSQTCHDYPVRESGIKIGGRAQFRLSGGAGLLRDALGRWLSRPVSNRIVLALVLLVCLLPIWLMAGPLLNYRIQADDYYHFGASRTSDRMLSNLMRPHNLHIVAIFRLVNWCLISLSG